MPVVMAQQGRRFKAKVAPELANSGYCPTKRLYYYGVKVHIIADNQPGSLPAPRFIGLSPAGMNDGEVLEQFAPVVPYQELYADKAYEYLARRDMPFVVRTPVKKQPGQEYIDAADRLLSRAVSQVRQPIESLFNWIEEKTGIEIASKVRSYSGLLVHVWGRLTAAMLVRNFSLQNT